MPTNNKTNITVETTVNAAVENAWEFFTKPEHITKWNFASEEWHCPAAENNLMAGGKFSYRMEARDESFGFDFGGVYDAVETNKKIEYTLGDERKVHITFSGQGNTTHITEIFEAEDTNPVEMQKAGWQMILNNFKKHVEAISSNKS